MNNTDPKKTMQTQNKAQTRRQTLRSRIVATLGATIFGAATIVGCQPLQGLDYDTSQPEMVAFGSCGELESFLERQAMTEANYIQRALDLGSSYDVRGFSNGPSITTDSGTNPDATPTSGPQNLQVSETNLQEAGVDEADIFKVDETHAFALHGNQLVIIEAYGDRVTPEPAPNEEPTEEPNDTGILQIDGGGVVARTTIEGAPFEMFLYADTTAKISNEPEVTKLKTGSVAKESKVVILTRVQHRDVRLQVEDAPNRSDSMPLTKAVVYDITDRSAPKIEREVMIEGEYLSSRRIGNQVYLISHSALKGPNYDTGNAFAGGWFSNSSVEIQNANLDAWIPYHYDTNYAQEGAVDTRVASADCGQTFASRATNGDDALGVYSFDVSRPDSAIKSTTILGDGAVVYGSKDSLIVALTNYGALTYGNNDDAPRDVNLLGEIFDEFGPDVGVSWDDDESDSFDEPTVDGGEELTYLHRFALGDEGDVKYHATGVVDGWILNQFSISEYEGTVRVATMRGRDTFEAESMVHVLKARDKAGILQAPAGAQSEFLQVIGSVRGIGEDEDLYATRFHGDVGYLVTFREVDPLWIVDLRDPSNPTLKGHLEVPGYSTYLHPMANQKLLAIGRGANEGIKLSLFDVSDLNRPTAIDERTEGSFTSESEALTNHKAFRFIPEENLLFVPMEHFHEQGLFAYRVDPSSGFLEHGVINHDNLSDSGFESAAIRRSYRINNYLYAYSRVGVTITDLNTMETVAEIDLEDVR